MERKQKGTDARVRFQPLILPNPLTPSAEGGRSSIETGRHEANLNQASHVKRFDDLRSSWLVSLSLFRRKRERTYCRKDPVEYDLAFNFVGLTVFE